MTVIPPNDPLTSVIFWRNDSIILSRFRHLVDKLDYLPPQPCVMGTKDPYICTRESPTVCVPCALRFIRADLAPEQEESNGPAVSTTTDGAGGDRPDDAGGVDPDGRAAVERRPGEEGDGPVVGEAAADRE